MYGPARTREQWIADALLELALDKAATRTPLTLRVAEIGVQRGVYSRSIVPGAILALKRALALRIERQIEHDLEHKICATPDADLRASCDIQKRLDWYVHLREELNQQRPGVWLVDAWREFPVDDYPEGGNAPQAEHDANYAEVLSFAESRVGECDVRVLRQLSVEAATSFESGWFDLVYIDANHTYAAVLEDLHAWHRVVRAGGILCGHDFTNIEPWCHVEKAVMEFAERFALSELPTRFGVVDITSRFPTWWLRV